MTPATDSLRCLEPFAEREWREAYRNGDGVEGAIVPRTFNAGVHGPLPPTPQGLYDGNRNGPAVLQHPEPGITCEGGDAHRAYHAQKSFCIPPVPHKSPGSREVEIVPDWWREGGDG